VANLRLAFGLRNRIIHGYDAVDAEIAYTTVVEVVPALKQDLLKLLSERG